ncbi:hypothetical protein H6F74_19810 [Trichocoleus sp. FACHB-90]|uniref:hypothetical protein n=1 Tax=Cyanophyceae TaxID=3028117 RepID=UPI0016851ED6|nr:hypothetical protein [Trichocoleus sp. FACHB-90]MBD1928476.1 hypothetical protein [Trichocoleus sp. FACHB-90]
MTKPTPGRLRQQSWRKSLAKACSLVLDKMRSRFSFEMKIPILCNRAAGILQQNPNTLYNFR